MDMERLESELFVLCCVYPIEWALWCHQPGLKYSWFVSPCIVADLFKRGFLRMCSTTDRRSRLETPANTFTQNNSISVVHPLDEYVYVYNNECASLLSQLITYLYLR